jgi:hypothetical protein
MLPEDNKMIYPVVREKSPAVPMPGGNDRKYHVGNHGQSIHSRK